MNITVIAVQNVLHPVVDTLNDVFLNVPRHV